MRWNPLDAVFTLVWLPIVRAFDLRDAGGEVDHGKAAGFLAFWAFIVLIAVGKVVATLGVVITLCASMFGSRVFVAFLRSRSVTVAATESHSTIITERRDAERGAEAS